MKKTGQFKLKTVNIEKIHSNLLSSRDLDSISPIEANNYLKKIKGDFSFPIENIFIHLNTDHLEPQNASILGIIRKDLCEAGGANAHNNVFSRMISGLNKAAMLRRPCEMDSEPIGSGTPRSRPDGRVPASQSREDSSSFLMACRNDARLRFNIPLDSLNGLNTKKYSDDCLIISDENDENEFTARNIENFGIYIFAGRPDLSDYKAFSPYLSLNNFESFQKKIIKFANIVELMVNGIYKENNTSLVENIEYELNNER